MAGGVADHVRVEGLHNPRVPHRGTDTLVLEEEGSVLGRLDHATHGDDAHIGALAHPASREPRTHLLGGHLAGGAAGVADGDRAVVDAQGIGDHHAKVLGRGRGEDGHARHLGQQGQVEHAVMRRSVGTGDAGAVDAEHDRQAVHADVEVDLVEGSGQERGVHGDHGTQTAHGHAGGGRDGVLLGDADVEEAVGEPRLEGKKAGGAGHGGGDGHDAGVALGNGQQCLGERLGVARRRRPTLGRPRRRIEDGRVVQALLLVVLGERVALALAGDDVHGDGPVEGRRLAQDVLHLGDVVPVDRTDIAHAQCLEEVAGFEHLTEGGPQPLHTGLEVLAHERNLAQCPFGPLPPADIGGARPEAGDARRQPGDGRGV